MPKARGPFLYAERIEDPTLPTVLCYGHGDVIRGLEGAWKDGRSPWQLDEAEGRYWGRGTADNKGQHSINIAALGVVLGDARAARLQCQMADRDGRGDRLPRPARIVRGEPRAVFRRRADRLGRAAPGGRAADDFSRQPRRLPDRPVDRVRARAATIPAIGAASSPIPPSSWRMRWRRSSVRPGRCACRSWLPDGIPDSVRRALADCEITSGPGDPVIDPDWGEPGLTLAEKVYAWCTFEILAMSAGNPESPVNAVPPRAWARAQVRFVVGVDPEKFLPALRRHLDRHGFPMVQVAKARDEVFQATRLDPEHPWVRFAATSLAKTANRPPAILPNIGGSLPNDIFADVLGLPTVWVPHSYPGCSQHAPNEHLPVAIAREALQLMAGLYWDLGEPGTPATGAKKR